MFPEAATSNGERAVWLLPRYYACKELHALGHHGSAVPGAEAVTCRLAEGDEASVPSLEVPK